MQHKATCLHGLYAKPYSKVQYNGTQDKQANALDHKNLLSTQIILLPKTSNTLFSTVRKETSSKFFFFICFR